MEWLLLHLPPTQEIGNPAAIWRKKSFLPSLFLLKFKIKFVLICMKLLVFAHTPPPHHGQSYMIQLMLSGFGGDQRGRKRRAAGHFDIECYHVNARFSHGVEDIGKFQGIKLVRLFLHCLEAIWFRFRYGVSNFYYIPAPGKRVALYRDWVVLLLCRPFFKTVILHWHAAGLAEWLETSAPRRTRAITRCLFKSAELSIVLSKRNSVDAEKLSAGRIRIVSNGIPDPCPDFGQSVLPRRKIRLATRTKLLEGGRPDAGELAHAGDDPQIVRVLFLAHCMKEKGLFDVLEGVVLANARSKQADSPLRLQLTVAGEFARRQEQDEFNRRVSQLKSENALRVDYLGFINGDAKQKAFAASDFLCFPTYYPAESFGLVVVEAMAFGLPIVATRWRSLPDILPPDYPGFVDPKSPGQIADALQHLAGRDLAESLRETFVRRFTLERHLASLADAIHSVEKP
jgi:glycosyltransferase involved in cell wall biosynthesis